MLRFNVYQYTITYFICTGIGSSLIQLITQFIIKIQIKTIQNFCLCDFDKLF